MSRRFDIDLKIEQVHQYVVTLCKENKKDHADKLLVETTKELLDGASEADAQYLSFRLKELRRQLDMPPCQVLG